MGIVSSMDIPSKRRGWWTSYCWNIALQSTNDLLSMIPLEPLLNFGSAPWQIHSKWSQILAIFSTSETLLLLNSGQMRASEKSFELDTSPEWCGCSLNCTGAPSRWTFEDEIRWDEGRESLHSFPPAWMRCPAFCLIPLGLSAVPGQGQNLQTQENLCHYDGEQIWTLPWQKPSANCLTLSLFHQCKMELINGTNPRGWRWYIESAEHSAQLCTHKEVPGTSMSNTRFCWSQLTSFHFHILI